MNTDRLHLTFTNIVVLFTDLRGARILRDPLLQALPGHRPEFVEVPIFMRLEYADLRTQLTIVVDSNRMEAKAEEPDDTSGVRLATLITNGRAAIQGADVTAYGFNVGAKADLAGNEGAGLFLVRHLQPALDPIAQQVQGEISRAALQVSYTTNGQQHQLTLSPEAGNGNTLDIGLNVHFAIGELPDEATIARVHEDVRTGFDRTMERLFQ